jgi:hypothetical protein
MSLFTHLAIAAVAAAFLSWMRGGIQDEPSLLPFFALIGFLGSLAISLVLHPNSQDWIDARLGSSARARLVRHAAALLLVGAVFWFAGAAISGVGAGGWLLLLVLGVLGPLVICLIAPGWHLIWGFAAATAMTASLWRHNLRQPWGQVPDPLSLVPDYLFVWITALVLASLVAVPRYLAWRGAPPASRKSVTAHEALKG